jgi:type II secretory pathway pseudopilin PulG
LVELLVVIVIIGLLAVATIPVVMPSLNQQQINFGARFLHGELAQARDRAIRDNAPRGIRLLPDPQTTVTGNAFLGPYTSSRIVTIEQAPDYNEGLLYDLSSVPLYTGAGTPPAYPPTYFLAAANDLRYSIPPLSGVPYSYGYVFNGVILRTWLVVAEVKITGTVPVPADPTAWFWNIRQGERLQFGNTGRSYPIAGPMSVGNSLAASTNPDRQINAGLPSVFQSLPGNVAAEFLIYTNGRDDNNNGFTDEQFDGLNNDGELYPSNFPIVQLRGQPIIDRGFNGIDDNGDGNVDEPAELLYSPNFGFPYFGEFESEQGVTTYNAATGVVPYTYSITRRAVPAADAREVALPRGVKIDLTGWNGAQRPYPLGSNNFPFVFPERSRLPVDPYTGYVDILLNPSGEIVPLAANASPGPSVALPFYHFWLAEDKDITSAFDDTTIQNNGIGFQLPMPKGTTNDLQTATYPFGLPALEGNQRIVSINARTGQVLTSTPVFSLNDLNRPFEAAQAGAKEEP